MKKFTFILASLLILQIATAQDSLRHYEFGSTVFTLNSFNATGNFGSAKPRTEFINGLFFRYSYKRFGFRAQTSYSENSKFYAFPDQNNVVTNHLTNKDFRIGIGGQYSLLKKKDWLYGYTDIFYRNIQTNGAYTGDYMNTNITAYARTSNGIDAFLGLGLKLKLSKSFYLSPEFGYNFNYGMIRSSYINAATNQPVKENFKQLGLNSFLKLQLSVKFK